MKKIRLSKCSLDKKEINSVIKTLSSDFLGMRPKVMQFEEFYQIILKEKQYVLWDFSVASRN